MNDQKDNLKLADMLRNLPEHDPPRDLTPLVMESLAPKKLSLWRRLCLLARTPRLVSITPLRLVTAVAACVLIFAVVFQLPPKRFETAVRRSDSQLVPVTFKLDANEARSVYLIGSFNGWKPEGYAMKLDRRSNRWIIEISIPPGGYEYAFLINHKQAIPDPKATFFKRDGFGSRNSVIYISSSDESVGL
jgi:hypothetical protein